MMRRETLHHESALSVSTTITWMAAWLLMAWPSSSAATAGPLLDTDAEYLMRKWEVDDGLPENSATAVVQTPQGYLWFGTFGGLVRFDGVQFTVYDESNTPELPHSGIVNLHLDRAGRLWIGTLGGMARLDGHQWNTFGKSDGWVGDFARTISERDNGDLLITTFDGRVLEYVDDRFNLLPTPPGEKDQGYFGFVDEAGRWSVVQHEFIGHWDGHQWHEVMKPEDVARSRFASASSRDGGQWILLESKLYKYRHGKFILHRTLENLLGGVWSIVEDSADNVWICSFDNGLYRLAPNGELSRWTMDNGLTYDGVRCVFEDRERNLWVGTSGGGLMQFVSRRARSFGVEDGLIGRVVNSLSADQDGNVWIATYDEGLHCWDGNEMSRIHLDKATSAQSVLADSNGRVWVGTYGEGLWRVEEGHASRIADDVVGDDNILALFEDSQGRVWFGGGRHVSRFKAGQFHILGSRHEDPDDGARAFCEDRTGTVWFANDNGVFRLARDGRSGVTDENGQAIQRAICLYTDSTGAVWIGLVRGGMLRWLDGEIARIDADRGLLGNAVHGMVEDSERVLWLSTDQGVVRGEVKDFHAAANGHTKLVCQLLDRMDGLPSIQMPSERQPVCGRDARGQLWFATQKGVATIDPKRFCVNTVPPPTVVSKLVYTSPAEDTRDQAIEREELTSVGLAAPFSQQVVLPAGSRDIEIHYSGLTFTAPSKARFQITLEGSHDDWRDVGSDRVANYHELAPGEYVFQVRAANNDGVWNSEGAQLQFRVTPYYWQTTWFRSGGILLAVVVTGGATWWAGHSRQHRRRREAERFRRVVEAAPNAMIVVDRQGRIVLVNTQAELVFGYDRDELIDQSIELLVPERFRAAHEKYRSEYVSRPTSRRMGNRPALVGRHKDGSDVAIEVGLTPFDDSRQTLVLASIVDVTERNKREIELARQRLELAHLSRVTMLGELSGSLAHELNQPLTAILSNAQAAQRFMSAKEVNLDEVREILAEIVDDDLRASEVIRRLRALFRKDVPAFQRLDIAEVLADVKKLMENDAILRQIDLTIEAADELPYVRGDRIQLQQVLLNLLLNAFDAPRQSSANGRCVVVEAQPSNQAMVRVCVCDNGPGLSEEALAKMFEPFFTTKRTGMGMGLSISRSIVEAHGGILMAENNPSSGASVWFTVPIDDGEPEQE